MSSSALLSLGAIEQRKGSGRLKRKLASVVSRFSSLPITTMAVPDAGTYVWKGVSPSISSPVFLKLEN